MADLKYKSNEFFWQYTKFFMMLAQDVTLTCKFTSDLIISCCSCLWSLEFLNDIT